jgi:prepilin-type N-terminal cleavage/methylation domain-containing protein
VATYPKERGAVKMFECIRSAFLRNEGGFTLIELLLVMVILGILFLTAVPSYLGFRARANNAAAQANVRSAVPVVETYKADNNTYVGMTLAALRTIDAGVATLAISGLSATSYCISNTVNGVTWRKVGPAGAIVSGAAC